MADYSGPWNPQLDETGAIIPGTGEWAEDQWYDHMPAAMPSGVIGTKASSATTGELALALSGRNWTVGAGKANVGGGGFKRTSPAGAAVPANTHATWARRDRLVLRRHRGTRDITVVRIQGTPAASPVAPATTRDDVTFDLRLFSFLVPANSGTTLTGIVDERTWVSDGTASAAFEPGLLDYAQSSASNLGNGGTAEGIISAPALTVALTPGRLYRAVWAGCVNAVGTGGSIRVNVRARLSGTPTTSSPVVGTWQDWLSGAGGPYQPTAKVGGSGQDFQVLAAGSYTFRVFGDVRSGSATSMQITPDARGVHSLAVYDVGTAPANARSI